MKRLAVILVIFFPSIYYGQDKLEGKYSTSLYYDVFSLTFKKNGTFDYSMSGCYMGEKAKGTYKIDHDKLTLNFDEIKEHKSYYSIKDYADCNTNGKDVKLIFKVKDKPSNESIPYANIILYSENVQIGGITADTGGVAQFAVAKSVKELEIKVAYVGYNKFSFKIKPEEICKTIEVHLDIRSNIALYHDGKPFDYKIEKTDTSTKLILIKGHGGKDLIFDKKKN